MSYPAFKSNAKKNWFVSVHTTIVSLRREEIVKFTSCDLAYYKSKWLGTGRGTKFKPFEVGSKEYHQHLLLLEWRVAFNLYSSCKYFEAIDALERVVAGGELGLQKRELGEESLHSNNKVHLCAARCSVELFFSTSAHYHLQNAYRHYQNSVETMRVDMATMMLLPPILFEYGRMLEYFGAFESALDLYGRILSNFPNYRGYFDAMYRSAVAGKHIASLTTDKTAKEETLSKCIDIYQFLLEALPSTINDIHIIIGYLRALEMSSNPSIRFRATGVYQSLFDLLRAQKSPLITNFVDFREFMNDSEPWYALGNIIRTEYEPLIASDAYFIFSARMDRRKPFGKDLSAVLEVDVSLTIAKNFASFQDYESAVKYGEFALAGNHFHKETRTLLSKWSQIHAAALEKERQSIKAIEMVWKGRCWSNGYRKRIQNGIIKDMEDQLANDRFDKDARHQLTYFARDKWRATFLFENHCATRIQRAFRELKKKWVWQSAVRAKYMGDASDAYRNYLKKPRDPKFRAEVIRVTNNRFCPKRHAIKKVRLIIDMEEAEINKIGKGFKAYVFRRNVLRLIIARQLRFQTKQHYFATKIQGRFRILKSKKIAKLAKEKYLMRSKFATKIQRFVRWRNSTFQHAVTRIIHQIRCDRIKAIQTFHSVFKYYFKFYKKRKEFQAASKLLKAKREAERLIQLEYQAKVERAANVIKKAFWNLKCRRAQTLIRKIVKAKREYEFSTNSKAVIQQYFYEERRVATLVGNSNGAALGSSEGVNQLKYRSPGIRQNSTQFVSMLQQQTVFCDETFTSVDCVMLSNVLKHASCGVQRLVLFRVKDGQSASYEFDLLGAISKCRSLRQVFILGGFYSLGFLAGIHAQVSVENPRIKEVYIEAVNQLHWRDKDKDKVVYKSENNKIGVVSGELAMSMSRLLMDYFNYTLPGIFSLSLHGCKLLDKDVTSLVAGLAVNSSLKYLYLSLNGIEDSGFCTIVETIKNNKKSAVTLIDFSFNLVELKPKARELLNLYLAIRRGDVETKTLKLILYFNIIYVPWNQPFQKEIPEIEVLWQLNVDVSSSSPNRGGGMFQERSSRNIPGTAQSNQSNSSTGSGERSARHAQKLAKVNSKTASFGLSSGNLGTNILTLRTESS